MGGVGWETGGKKKTRVLLMMASVMKFCQKGILYERSRERGSGGGAGKVRMDAGGGNGVAIEWGGEGSVTDGACDEVLKYGTEISCMRRQ